MDVNIKYYIEKLFKQYPFIYETESNYFIFGQNVCCIASEGRIPSLYNSYKESLNKDNKDEMIKYFKKIKTYASYTASNNTDVHPLNTFEQIKFPIEQIQKLVEQINIYIDISKMIHGLE